MPGRVTEDQRKTMLRLTREGLSQSEIMKRLNIWDSRTIKRNLKIAEGEEMLERVRERELAEATSAHMNEIRSVIERWKDNIQTSPFAIGVDALARCRNLEREKLFDCIKGHLPFESLWRDYRDWKDMHVHYIGWNMRLLNDVAKQGEVKMKLGMRNRYYHGAKLTEKFAYPMIERLDDIIAGEKPRAFEFSWREMVGEEGQRLMALCIDGEDVMVAERGKAEGEGYERRYQEIFNECLENHINKRFTDLSTLRDKIEARLEEILISRAYIEHRCRLCPGQRPSS